MTAGCLSPGAHPGSYNGQDAWNNMLVTDERSMHGQRTALPNYNEANIKQPGLYARCTGNSHMGGCNDTVEPTMMSDRKGHNGITEDGVSTTLNAQEKERPLISDYWGDPSKAHEEMNAREQMVGDSIVRRLTPKECERLQGFPDGWTLIGKPEEVEVNDYMTEWIPGKDCKYESVQEALKSLSEAGELEDADESDEELVEDAGGNGFDPKKYGFVKKRTQIGSHTEIQYFYTDRDGKRRRCADSNRYKAIGNSIALPFWEWLARRICAQYERPVTMASLFDGIGGFPLAFSRCGAIPVWASEIEEFPIAVTKRHFPEEGDAES